jgi:ATP-dependent Lon protease
LLVLKKELIKSQLQSKLSRDVDSKIAKRQREYYLMQQPKGIKKELGMESDGKDKLIEKLCAACHAGAVKHVFEEELAKLTHLEPAASEANVTRNYLNWLTQIPWCHHSPENYSIAHAKDVLDEDHYGLKDVKDCIQEFLAVGRLRGTVEGKIICLAGPPGVDNARHAAGPVFGHPSLSPPAAASSSVPVCTSRDGDAEMRSRDDEDEDAMDWTPTTSPVRSEQVSQGFRGGR